MRSRHGDGSRISRAARRCWRTLRASSRRVGRCRRCDLRSLSSCRPGRSDPAQCIGCAVALADKLDSIVGCFAVGVVPTGSSDPYALRRGALGVVKIILEGKLPVSLPLAIGAAAKALSTYDPKRNVSAAQERQILDFILDRGKFVFRERSGFAYDEVNAVFSAGAEDLVDVQKRLAALRTIRKSKNFEPLTVSFKRIRKILEKS